jgi:hypothetical protein
MEYMAIASIENLSNEIFYEIFDYLDGYYLCKAFSNLNQHFQQLLSSSSLLLKLHVDAVDDQITINEIKQFILLYKHNIISFHFDSAPEHIPFFLSSGIDSSFIRLESLYINRLNPMIHGLLISNLTSLPRLYSFTVNNPWHPYEGLSNVYQLILTLPKLKYAKCSVDDYDISASLSIPINTQFSSIEQLIINHNCTFKDLFPILSHTPQICYLKCQNLIAHHSILDTISPVTLANLSYISMNIQYVTFDQFEWLISKLHCQLEILRITVTLSLQTDYLNGNRWEKLLSEYLPKLEEFYFQYSKASVSGYDAPIYSDDPNPFISSFWIEQEWLLEIEMDSFEIIYSICPYELYEKESFLLKILFFLFRDRWYDIIYFTDLGKSTRLTITCVPHDENLDFLMTDIDHVLTMAHIYH